MSDRYGSPQRQGRSEDEWHELARAAVLRLLEREHAVTIVEMEAKVSDRTYDPAVCPDPINPHHLTTARHTLEAEGRIMPTTAPAKSKDHEGEPHQVTTWSPPPAYGVKTAIEKAADRKRALMARWLSWGTRHLLGHAGESALAVALEHTGELTQSSGSTQVVLGVDVGEVDNTAVFVDRSEPTQLTAIQVMFEVKNTREYYYANDEDVLDFLAKAATVQAARPRQLVLPVFVCRRWQFTLWRQGEALGFLPAMVSEQVVRKDPDLGLDEWTQRFNEVRNELLPDIRSIAAGQTTNRHLGIVNKLVPTRARQYAALWGENHAAFLPS